MNHSEIVGRRVILEHLESMSHESTLQLLHATTLLAVIVANTLMEREVVKLAGTRSQRKDDSREYYRLSANPRSVRINHEKVPVTVPRLRHRISKKVISPSIYRQLHDLKLDEQAAKRIIAGISTRDFDDSARTIVESFGLSKSAISQDFIAASSKALEEFQSRDLSGEPYVTLFLDGKTFADELIILAMGVTKKGSKHIVGMTQAPGESRGGVSSRCSTISWTVGLPTRKVCSV